MRIPIFGVDPTVIGPRELARRKKEQLIEWARQPIISVALVAVAGLLGYGLMTAGVSIPEAPNWVSVALITFAVGSVVAWRVGGKLASEIHETETVTLVELNVYNGDARIIQLAPERFRDVTVVNHHWDPGEEPMEDAIVGRERLHEISINGTRAFEVDKYDPVLNVAVGSWQMDRASIDLRRDHEQIEQIKTEMEDQIDTVYEVLSREHTIIRQAVMEQVSEITAKMHDGTMPEDARVETYDEVSDLLDERGIDDELLDEADSEGDANRDLQRQELENGDVDDSEMTEVDIK
jgi:hypothetical protein